MKTIISLLLLPIMVLAQSYDYHQNERFDITFSMDVTMESAFDEEIGSLNILNESIELLVTVEIYILEMGIDDGRPPLTYDGAMVNSPPKYLNTFSLVGWPTKGDQDQNHEERLNRLLALNDPEFPKEDTIFSGLRPVRYQQRTLKGVENMAEGFGPRIRL